MADIIAQHNMGGGNLKKIYGTIRLCQTFQLTGDAAKNALYVNHRTAGRVGTLGDITIAIYGVDGAGKPTGDSLGTVTIASTNWQEIPGIQNPMEDADVEFDDCTLQPATTYALVMSATDGDSSNYIYWYSNTGGYSDGEAFVSADDGDNWTPITGEDFGFLVFGNPLVPGKPTNPLPTNEATDITLDQTPLSWDASDPAADTYNVYFRVQGEEWTEVSNLQEAIEWAIVFGTLGYGTTYEWRVDATNDAGTTTGDTWSFTCLVFAPPLPTGVTLDADGEPTGTPTGENTMLTVKRLVAAAENAFYYEDI